MLPPNIGSTWPPSAWVRGGYSAEKVILRNLALFISAAGEPFRWALTN